MADVIADCDNKTTIMGKRAQVLLRLAGSVSPLIASSFLPAYLDHLLHLFPDHEQLLISIHIPIKKCTLTASIACTIFLLMMRDSFLRQLFKQNPRYDCKKISEEEMMHQMTKRQ